jgi:uncharacterized protein YecE (DUF72 family)
MIHIGSCSWTEKSLIKSREFYPKGVSTAEQRLRYYASNFDVVEVDSSYYAIPAEKTVVQWAERTPRDFIFHIKAYALLTGHSADLRAIPPEVRDMLPAESLKKDRVALKEKGPLEAAFRLFREALRPLAETGKAGIVVFQYPPFFAYRTQNLDYILLCRELMKGFGIGVEFRHGSWLTPGTGGSVFSFLRENGITYIAADEPQYGNLSTAPFVPEVTTEIAYFRLHGRNRENWFKRGGETSLRYDYLYSDEELREFITPVGEAAKKAKETYVMFNNCHLGYSMKNALRLREMMKAGRERVKNTA